MTYHIPKPGFLPDDEMTEYIKSHLDPVQQDRIVTIRRSLNQFTQGKYRVSPRLVYKVCTDLDIHLSREGRIKFLQWMFSDPGITTSKYLTPGQGLGLVMWSGLNKDEITEKWGYAQSFQADVHLLVMVFLKQGDMFGGPEKPKHTEAENLKALGY
jgi:hypothetical protein